MTSDKNEIDTHRRGWNSELVWHNPINNKQFKKIAFHGVHVAMLLPCQSNQIHPHRASPRWRQHFSGKSDTDKIPTEVSLPATRTTALSAGSNTESWLLRLRRSCLDRFQGSVSPGALAYSDEGQGESEPSERSLRKDGSLTHERSLRVSSSDDSMGGVGPAGGGRGEQRVTPLWDCICNKKKNRIISIKKKNYIQNQHNVYCDIFFPQSDRIVDLSSCQQHSWSK